MTRIFWPWIWPPYVYTYIHTFLSIYTISKFKIFKRNYCGQVIVNLQIHICVWMYKICSNPVGKKEKNKTSKNFKLNNSQPWQPIDIPLSSWALALDLWIYGSPVSLTSARQQPKLERLRDPAGPKWTARSLVIHI